MLIFILQFFLILFSPVKAAQLIQGDIKTENSTQSFSFPIGFNKTYRPNGMLFVAARQLLAGNNFAVSYANIGDTAFKGLTFGTTKLNNTADKTNPLNGAKINQMALLGAMPVVVKEGEESVVYMINKFDNVNFNAQSTSVISSPNVHDASGTNDTAKIIGLETSQPGTETNTIGFAIFAAVTSSSGNFGTGDSGIALLEYKIITNNIKVDGKAQSVDSFFLDIFDAQAGIAKGNKAAQLNVSTDAAKINGDLTAITNQIVDMHWDDTLSRLYIALQGQSGPGATDGIRAVVMAYVENNKLVLIKIAPDSAISGSNQIIAARGPLSSVALDKLRTMRTSTYLKYLITTSANQVFALPLVSEANDSMGTIANKNQIPLIVFSDKGSKSFTRRTLIEPATTPEQMPTSSDVAAVIGQGPLPANVQDIFISGDAVFVAVAQNGDNLQPGIFHSQAILGTDGKIVNWTKWQPAYVNGKSIFGVDHDVNSTRAWFLTGTTQIATDAFNVERTYWGSGEENISKILSAEFPKNQSGVQGVFDFAFDTESFSTTVGERISLSVFAGFEKILLLQSGSDTDNFFGAETNFGKINFASNDGTLSGLISEDTNTGISIFGGALKELGPIVAAEIITDGDYGWLAVAGVGGVAVLADENGKGWNAIVGLQKGFIGINNNFAFRKIGNFKNVRKLIAHNNNLYVLSDESLDRFVVSASAFKNDILNVVQLAVPQKFMSHNNTYFSDFLIKDKIALLATSSGLLRTPPNTNLDNVNDVEGAQWTFLNLPESVGPITRFYNISSNKNSSDPTNIYFLNAYVGLQQSRIYRAYLNNDIFILLPDQFVRDKTSFFLNIGNYRNYLATDGANLFVSRSRFISTPAFLEIYKLNSISSSISAPRTAAQVFLNINDFKSLTNLVKNSGNGSWMLGGDFGLRVNQ